MQVELSISLHGPDDKTRSRLMPINKKYPLSELIGACGEYINKTNRQITFEYVLIKGQNDSAGNAKALEGLLKDMGSLAKVNLITFNAVNGFGFVAPQPGAVKDFKAVLDKGKIMSTIRVSRGTDIDAACGQLRLRHEK
ncbi:MAG: hypothetical protein NTV07_06585 [Candidatus Omnitrophica bacterium]|nr:hypothetical protein [Candidatus Omnitrophota bacterium]